MKTKKKINFKKTPILKNRVKEKDLIIHSPHLYEISSNTLELSQKSEFKHIIMVLYGAPGSGKDTLLDKLIANKGQRKFYRTKNATTRPQRPGEEDDAQMFMTEEIFEASFKAGSFIETNEHRSDGKVRKYGTLKSEVSYALENGMIPVLRVDPTGAKTIRSMWKRLQEPFKEALLVSICITTSHEHHLYDRLLKREIEKGEDPIKAQKKVEDRVTQIKQDIVFEDAHYILVNREGEIDKVVLAIKHIWNLHSKT